jgi:hypothetical protein
MLLLLMASTLGLVARLKPLCHDLGSLEACRQLASDPKDNGPCAGQRSDCGRAYFWAAACPDCMQCESWILLLAYCLEPFCFYPFGYTMGPGQRVANSETAYMLLRLLYGGTRDTVQDLEVECCCITANRHG